MPTIAADMEGVKEMHRTASACVLLLSLPAQLIPVCIFLKSCIDGGIAAPGCGAKSTVCIFYHLFKTYTGNYAVLLVRPLVSC